MKPVLTIPEGRTVLWYSEKWDKYVAFSQKDIIEASKAISNDMNSNNICDRIVASNLFVAISFRGGIKHISELL